MGGLSKFLIDTFHFDIPYKRKQRNAIAEFLRLLLNLGKFNYNDVFMIGLFLFKFDKDRVVNTDSTQLLARNAYTPDIHFKIWTQITKDISTFLIDIDSHKMTNTVQLLASPIKKRIRKSYDMVKNITKDLGIILQNCPQLTSGNFFQAFNRLGQIATNDCNLIDDWNNVSVKSYVSKDAILPSQNYVTEVIEITAPPSKHVSAEQFYITMLAQQPDNKYPYIALNTDNTNQLQRTQPHQQKNHYDKPTTNNRRQHITNTTHNRNDSRNNGGIRGKFRSLLKRIGRNDNFKKAIKVGNRTMKLDYCWYYHVDTCKWMQECNRVHECPNKKCIDKKSTNHPLSKCPFLNN